MENRKLFPHNIQFRVTKKTYDKLKRASKQQAKTMSEFLRDLVNAPM